MMLLRILPIAGLMSGVALLLIGNGLLNTLVAVRGSEAGFSDALLGLLGTGYFAGYLLGGFIARPLIQRVGHIRAFAFFATAIAAVALMHGLLVSPATWVALRVISGASIVSLYTLIESWLNEQAPPAIRGRIFAVYMVVNQVSLAIAQQILRLDPAEAFALFSVSALFVCFAVMPVSTTQLTQPGVYQRASLSVFRILRGMPVAALSALLTGMAMGAFWSMGPVYAARAGHAGDWVAWFMSAGILGGALLQWPLGVLSDRGDRRVTLAIVALLAALSAVPLFFDGIGGPAALVAITLFGAFAFAVYPIAVALLCDHLPAESVVAGSSAVLLLHGIGAAIGPSVVGLGMSWLSAAALALHFVGTHLLLAVIAGVAALRYPEQLPDHAHCVPMMRTSATVLEIMPTSAEHRNGDEMRANDRAPNSGA